MHVLEGCVERCACIGRVCGRVCMHWKGVHVLEGCVVGGGGGEDMQQKTCNNATCFSFTKKP